jgi:molecular chaperone GrpE
MNNEQEAMNNEQDKVQSEESNCEKCDAYLDGWKRAQADYQNLQKQVEKEKVDFRKYANQSLLEDLLPAIDQFELAIKFMPSVEMLPPDQQQQWKNWRTGVEAVKMKWDEFTNANGLAPIEVIGSFDPQLHEAVEEREQEGAEPGVIIEVVSGGWKLHDKVIRPARVIVAK